MSAKAFWAVMGVLAVIALLAFGVFAGGDIVEVGDEVPAAELEVLAEGELTDSPETLSVADLEGQWVLLNVWASWCDPCEDEAPDLVDFQERYGGKGSNFTVLGIQTQDGTAEGLEFVEEYGLNYPSIRDGSGDYSDDLGTTGVPESILVNPAGEIAYMRPGPIDSEILDAEVLPRIGAATQEPDSAS